MPKRPTRRPASRQKPSLKTVDWKSAAEAALAFVDSVVRQGWMIHPGNETSFPEPGWRMQHMELLLRWERATNPTRMSFRKLDGMGWLFDGEKQHMIEMGKEMECAVLLIASLGWVIRLWCAEALCQDGDWDDLPPYYGLPLGIVEAIFRAAEGLRAGTRPTTLCVEPWAARPARVALSETITPAWHELSAASDIHRNLTQDTRRNIQADWNLFRSRDRLNWHASRLPVTGYEACFSGTAFQDAGFSGTCAHVALQNLRNATHMMLSSGAFESRGRPAMLHSGWGESVYWTPEARALVVDHVPRINPSLWLSQLEIERVRMATAPTNRRPTGPEQDGSNLCGQYVTLLQVATLAKVHKHTLETWVRDGKLPTADVKPGPGKANKWLWGTLRPCLEQEIRHVLPVRFPSLMPGA